ncbi:MAG: hypothetical protein SGPRY_014122 [Prymnesium sp.]
MDCTGSMGAYISSAKQNIEAIVDRLVAQENFSLRVSLVAYRDHPPQDRTYVTKSFPFTSDLSQMKDNLRSLSAQGGGDGPEAVAAALHATLHQGWREEATKVCILIADAPPHGLGENGDGFPEGGPDGVDPLSVLDEMSSRGICIYAVGCQPALSRYRFATDFFIACADRTNGQAVALGSAAMLAEVIMGGAIEEMDLERISTQVQQQVLQLRASEPGLAEEEVQRKVFRGLSSAGCRTRHMRSSKLQAEYGACFTNSASLSMARETLKSAPAPPPRPRGAAFGGTAAAPSKAKQCRRMRRRSECEKDKKEERVDVWAEHDEAEDALAESMDEVRIEEESISLEQVSRVFGKCKKKGMF